MNIRDGGGVEGGGGVCSFHYCTFWFLVMIGRGKGG